MLAGSFKGNSFEWLFLSEPPIRRLPGSEGFRVHLGASVQKTVAFLGYEDPSAPGGLRCTGTGFLLGYDGEAYLVTNRHVAEPLADIPFIVRVNNKADGGSFHITSDGVNRWDYHHDRSVDLAAMPLRLPPSKGFDVQYIAERTMVRKEDINRLEIGVGDLLYTVGLFRYISGAKQNLPMVYTGNLALLSEEKVPVWDRQKQKTEYVQGCLMQSQGIHGASGSPVFVRPAWGVEVQGVDPPADELHAQMLSKRVFLFGIYQGAWFLPPDATLRAELGAKENDSLPVGLGIVIPTYKLIELLESGPVKEKRSTKQKIEFRTAENTAVPVPDEAPKATDANPQHREDFTSLLNAAARKQPQGG